MAKGKKTAFSKTKSAMQRKGMSAQQAKKFARRAQSKKNAKGK